MTAAVSDGKMRKPRRGATSAGRIATPRSLRGSEGQADGGAEAIRVVEVMELLRDAGAERLRLLTVTGGG